MRRILNASFLVVPQLSLVVVDGCLACACTTDLANLSVKPVWSQSINGDGSPPLGGWPPRTGSGR